MKKKITTLMFLILFIILAYNMMFMPTVPNTSAPSYNDTVYHYINEGVNETGATNIVAAILADYRAFDTLGETIVLFTSIVAVSSVLRTTQKKDEEETTNE